MYVCLAVSLRGGHRDALDRYKAGEQRVPVPQVSSSMLPDRIAV